MTLLPDDGPWSIYPLEDGDELLDAHNDILLKFQPNIEPRTKKVIAAAPDMEACLRLMLEAQKEKDASRRERNEAAFMVALVKERDAYQLAEALLKRIEGEDDE